MTNFKENAILRFSMRIIAMQINKCCSRCVMMYSKWALCHNVGIEMIESYTSLSPLQRSHALAKPASSIRTLKVKNIRLNDGVESKLPLCNIYAIHYKLSKFGSNCASPKSTFFNRSRFPSEVLKSFRITTTRLVQDFPESKNEGFTAISRGVTNRFR